MSQTCTGTVLIWTLMTLISRAFTQNLDIVAFEYARKFPELPSLKLNVGQCAHSIEEVAPGVAFAKKCFLPPMHGKSVSLAKKMNDTQNIEVKALNDIFTYIGLCKSDAVSRLGLLHRGDCLAIDIASNLTFSKKSYTRAYIEYYRHHINILKDAKTNIPPSLIPMNGNKFYIWNLSHGSMEVVIVEMKFTSKKDVEKLKKSNYHSLHMSDWMKYVQKEVGHPTSSKVIRVSTANRIEQTTKFKKKDFNKLQTLVGRYEAEISDIRGSIERGYIHPHLNYGLRPYSRGLHTAAQQLTEKNDLWEQVSELEIEVNRAEKRQRSLQKKCKKAKLPECVTIKKVKNTLSEIGKGLHSQRIHWSGLNVKNKTETISSKQKQIKLLKRKHSKMSKKLKVWQKQQKAKKKAKKQRRKKLKGEKKKKKKKSKKRKSSKKKKSKSVRT